MPAPTSIGVDINVTSQSERNILGFLQNVERKANSAGGPLGNITRNFDQFSRSLEASNARVLAFGASAGLLFGVEKAFSAILGAGVNLEKKLKDINVILGASSGNLAVFGKNLFQIAKDTGQSFDSVADAAKELSRQGLGVQETLKRTRDALILTRLTGLDTTAALEDLTAAVNTFKDSALDTTDIINKFAKVDASFAVSSADLAESIKRTGASAADAGVNIDQLIALVTSLQQTTARGGPVIGNAIKSIFGRIEKPEVLDSLQAVGVSVRNSQGNLPAVQILSNLANSYDKLSVSGKSFVTTQVGSLYQINLLKAALSDLSKENSIYNQALKQSESATDEAITRNAELNTTLSAQLNILKVNATQLAGNVGGSLITQKSKNNLGFLSTGLSDLNDAAGTSLGKGIIGGVGDALGGPGVIIAGIVAGKLLINLTKDILKGLNSILGLNQQSFTINERIAGSIGRQASAVALVNKELQVQNTILAEQNSILFNTNPVTSAPFVASVNSLYPQQRNPAGQFLSLGSRNGVSFNSNSSVFPIGALGNTNFVGNNSNFRAGNPYPSAITPNPFGGNQLSYSEKYALSAPFQSPGVSRNSLLLGAGLGIPILSNLIKESAGTDSRTGRNVGAISDVLGSTASRAATAGFITGGNPYAIGGGAIFGFIGSIKQAFSDFNSTLPDLQKNLENSKDTLNTITDELGQYTDLTEKLGEIYAGQTKASPGTIATLERRQSELVSKLAVANPNLLNDLKTGNSSDVISKFLQNENYKSRSQQVGLNLQSIKEKTGFLGLGDTGTVDTSNIGYIYNTLFGSGKHFTSKLDTKTNSQVIDFASYLKESKTSTGDPLSKLLQSDQSGSNLGFFKNFEGYKNEINNAAKGNISKLNSSSPAAKIADSFISDLKELFSDNEEVLNNIESIDSESNIGKKILELNTLINNIPATAKQIAAQIDFVQTLLKKSQLFSKQYNQVQDFTESFVRRNQGSIVGLQSINELTNQKNKNIAEQQIYGSDLATKYNSQFLSPEAGARSLFGQESFTAQTSKNLSLVTNQSNFETQSQILRKQAENDFAKQIEGLLKTKEGEAIKESLLGRSKAFITEIGQNFPDQFKTEKQLEDLKSKRSNFQNISSESTRQELDAQIETLSKALTQLTEINTKHAFGLDQAEEEYENAITKATENLKNNLLNSLENKTATGIRRGTLFSGEIAGNRLSVAEDKIRYSKNAAFPDVAETFFNQWSYGVKDLYKDINNQSADLAKGIKSSFGDALKSIAVDGKSAGDVFRQLGLNIAGKIAGNSIDNVLNYGLGQLSSATGLSASSLFKSNGGYIQKFAGGGPVFGGSGAKDDIPAMLSRGEYVIKKSAVNSIGLNNLNKINGYAGGGNVSSRIGPLSNDYDTINGRFNIDSRLSGDALDDSLNPQNSRRNSLESSYQSYKISRLKFYENLKQQQSAADTGKIINLIAAVANAGLSSYAASNSYSKFSNTNVGSNYNSPAFLDSNQRFAHLGGIMGYAGGGMSKDNVPAMLMGGEYVVKKDVVDRFGKPFFDKMNRGGMVARYAEGGIVGSSASSPTENNDKLNRLVTLFEDFTTKYTQNSNSFKNNKQTGNNSNNQELAINITLTNVSDNKDNNENQNKTQNQAISNDGLKQLKDVITNEVHKIIINEKRAGGALSSVPR